MSSGREELVTPKFVGRWGLMRFSYSDAETPGVILMAPQLLR